MHGAGGVVVDAIIELGWACACLPISISSLFGIGILFLGVLVCVFYFGCAYNRSGGSGDNLTTYSYTEGGEGC